MSTTEDCLSVVYSDEAMNTVSYQLHAVLVHQGQASGGHYWSYIRKPPSLVIDTSPAPVGDQVKSSVATTAGGSEVVMSGSPAMSTESGGRGGGGEEGGGKGGEGRREKKRRGGGWLKFNDVSVHEVCWEEVVKESYGGHHNTSAYCLIYLSPLLKHSSPGTGEPFNVSSILQYRWCIIIVAAKFSGY